MHEWYEPEEDDPRSLDHDPRRFAPEYHRRLRSLFSQHFTTFDAQMLRISQPTNGPRSIQDHGGHHHRAGQGAAACFVYASANA